MDFNSNEDAGIFEIDKNCTVIQSIDLITPLVERAEDFGAISIANALSDIYAKGGIPLFASNILGVPKSFDEDTIFRILKGGMEKLTEANVRLLGGHTFYNNEPIYGASITGIIQPENIIRNSTARFGDKLFLTKSIGVGIVATAFKNRNRSENLDFPQGIFDETLEQMKTTNKSASDAMKSVGINACTDITGFGLIGHIFEMVSASKAGAILYYDQIPFIKHIFNLLREGYIPSGIQRNIDGFQKYVTNSKVLSKEQRFALYDIQTSGGLLISVQTEKVKDLLSAFKKKGLQKPAIIGEVTKNYQKIDIQ